MDGIFYFKGAAIRASAVIAIVRESNEVDNHHSVNMLMQNTEKIRFMCADRNEAINEVSAAAELWMEASKGER